MSAEQSRQITDVFKWVAYVAITISSFIISNTYTKMDNKMDKLFEQAEQINARLIRVEYELKLK